MSRKQPTPPPEGIKKPDPPPGPQDMRWRVSGDFWGHQLLWGDKRKSPPGPPGPHWWQRGFKKGTRNRSEPSPGCPRRGEGDQEPLVVRTQRILYGEGPHGQPPGLTSLVDDRPNRCDPPIKRNLGKFRDDETMWDRMNDWCEDQLMSWGSALDRHYGLWCVGLLVFLVTVLSIALTVRLM